MLRGNRALLGDHGRPIGRKPSRARPLGGGRAAYPVISNMCTVFAESEVISLVGEGEPRANVARGVIDSVVARVHAGGAGPAARYRLTGGLCENDYVRARLEAE